MVFRTPEPEARATLAPVTSPARPLPRSTIEPVAADRWQWRITMDGETKAKLDRLRGYLGHEFPDGDLEKVLAQMIDDSLEKQGKRLGLEMDHLEPAAKTGSSGVDDLTTRCRIHNQYRAVHRGWYTL